jgi:hypothetical protein
MERLGDRRDKSVAEPLDRRSRLPAEQRLTRTNITKFTADSPLIPSGLLSPVTVEATQVARMSGASQ